MKQAAPVVTKPKVKKQTEAEKQKAEAQNELEQFLSSLVYRCVVLCCSMLFKNISDGVAIGHLLTTLPQCNF